MQRWEMQDNPQHLRTIRDRILEGGGSATGKLLGGLYQQVLQRPNLPLGDTPEQSQAQSLLQLSGLVVKRGSGLQAEGQKLDHSDYQFRKLEYGIYSVSGARRNKFRTPTARRNKFRTPTAGRNKFRTPTAGRNKFRTPTAGRNKFRTPTSFYGMNCLVPTRPRGAWALQVEWRL